MGTLTYFGLLLPWGLLVVLGQIALGGAALLRRWRFVLAVVLPMTAYLGLGDAVALQQGIWQIHSDRIVGIYVGNVPVEEITFFLLTNLMVVQGIVLFNSPQVRARLARRLLRSSLP